MPEPPPLADLADGAELPNSVASAAAATQPVHTLYVGAQHVDADWLEATVGHVAATAERFAGSPRQVEDLLGVTFTEDTMARLRDRLVADPIEDVRLDFEDGFGARPEAEELEIAAATAAVAAGWAGRLRRFGIRVKPLDRRRARRCLATTERFITTLVAAHGGLPPGFRVTLPKVEDPAQPALMDEALSGLERRLGLDSGVIDLEIMIETPRGLFGSDGSVAVRHLATATPRCRAVHFGVYDYTTAIGIAAPHQHLRHPACDFARDVMQVSLAGSGIERSDGSTAQLPAGSSTDVAAALRRHFDDVMHSLAHGWVQGWDLHPGQVITRHAANLVFHRDGLDTVMARLRALLASGGAVGGAVLDDPATGDALLRHLRRAVAVGAVDAEAAAEGIGVPVAALYGTGGFINLLGDA